MTNRDMGFFKVAKEVADMSDFNRVHIGCVITQKNRIISSGYNTYKTNPLQRRYNRERFLCDTPHCCHAETRALLPILKNKEINFSHLKVYLYRQNANGELAPSRPCPSCMKMLKDTGIRRIYYTTENGFAEEYIME